MLARKAHGGPGNVRTGGEAETLRWVSDDLFPEAGDRPRETLIYSRRGMPQGSPGQAQGGVVWYNIRR